MIDHFEERLRDAQANKLNEKELLDLSIQILLRPKQFREENEIEILKKFTEKIEFFSKIKAQQGADTLTELCKNLEIESHDKSKVLFQEGSVGTKFYIILVGSVEVYIKGNKKTVFGEDIIENTKVGEIPQGKSFGELAIMDEVLKPRKATIICKENCHFATLSRTAFQNTLGHLKKEMVAQIEALTSNPIFSKSKWSNRAIEQWFKLFDNVGYKINRNTYIYKEGDLVDDIYFVKSGELTCVKKTQIIQPLDFKKDIILDEKNQVYQLEKQPLFKNVDISIWGEGVIFGEEEALEVYKQERLLEKEREKMRKALKETFIYERRKAEQDGYSYKPPKNLYIPDDPMEDDEAINDMIRGKIEKESKESCKRETTVFVSSQRAEVWKISKRIFFSHLEPNLPSWTQLEALIEAKKQRRQERIEEFQRYAVNNIEYLGKQSSSIMKKDLLSLIKKKKQIKHEKHNKIVFKEDPAFPKVVKSLKAIKEAKIKQAEMLGTTVETEPSEYNNLLSEFPLIEMRHKSILTIRPDPEPDPVIQEIKIMNQKRAEPRNRTLVNRTSMELEHVNAKYGRKTVQFNEFAPLYGSFFSQLEDSNFNRYMKKRSKIFAGERSGKHIDYLKVNNNAPSASIEALENTTTVIIDNPLKGLNYTTNIVYQDNRKLTDLSDTRLTSHERFHDDFNAETVIKKRLNMKKNLVNKMLDYSPTKKASMDKEPFFTVSELKESEENFVQDFKQLSRKDNLNDMIHEIRLATSTSRNSKSPKRNSIDIRRPSTTKNTKPTEDTRVSTEEEIIHVIHELHKGDYSQDGILSPDRRNSKSPNELSVSQKGFQSPFKKDASRVNHTEGDSPLMNFPSFPRSKTPHVINRKTLQSFLLNPDKLRDSSFTLHNKNSSKLLSDNSLVNVTNTSFSILQPAKNNVTSTSFSNFAEQLQESRLIKKPVKVDFSTQAGKPSPNKKPEPEKQDLQRVRHEAPKFTPHHRVLSAHESNVLNRKPIIDKAMVILNRLGRSPTLPPHIKKKLQKRNKLIVKGRKEQLLELPEQQQQQQQKFRRTKTEL